MAAQQDPNAEKGTGLLWGIAFIFGVILLIWMKYKQQLIAGYIFIKQIELSILEIVSYLPIPGFNDQVMDMIDYLDNNSYNPDTSLLMYIAEKTGFYLAFFQLLLSGYLFSVVWKTNAQVKYKTKHSMRSLSNQEQHNWVQIMPITSLNLVDDDVNKGPWSMALTPLQFCKKFELITVETVIDRKSPWKTEGIKKSRLLKDKALDLFKSQMGQIWEGENALPPHRKALFAVFLARIEHDTNGATQLLEELSISYAKGSLDYASVDPLLKKHRQSKAAIKCVQNHAYVLTVLASMLKLARTDGVLATSSFIWLKPTDRELWYMLNCVGRQTPYCETAGPFAHLIAEEELGRPLFKPIVDKAVSALEDALEKIVYTDDN